MASVGGGGKGGVLKYEPFQKGLRNLLKLHDRPGVWFSSMIDLYALPKTFPGWDASRKQADPYARVKLLEDAMEKDIGDRRFIPYIQLYEFEALLFADPASLAYFYPDQPKALAALQAVADSHTCPELINDGKTTAPSKRIIAEIPDYGGAKCTAGPQVAELIGLDVLRAKCPHFQQWVDRLAGLARSDDKAPQ